MGIENIGKNQWYILVRIRKNGKIVQRKRTITGTREDARQEEALLKQEIRECAEPCSLTIRLQQFKHILEVYRAEFLIENGYPFSPGHETKVRLMEKEFGECEILLFPDRFKRYIDLTKKEGKLCKANRFIEIARAAYQRCIKKKLVPNNPITEEDFPETKQIARDTYLPPEEITKIILTAAKNRRTCHIARALQFFFAVPCRRSEVINMKVKDVNLSASKIRVFNGTTKNDVGTWKPIPPTMLNWFNRRMLEKESIDEPLFYRIVKGSRKNRTGVLSRKAPLGDFKKAWQTVREKCGYPNLHLHDSRHISATDMVNRGTPRTVVNNVAGWKTDMLQIYYHSDSDAAFSAIKWG